MAVHPLQVAKDQLKTVIQIVARSRDKSGKMNLSGFNEKL